MNHDATFQTLVANWMNTVFEGQGGKDIQTRCFRFLEEALELVQSLGCTKDEALQMVEYTYSRPAGVPIQEVGGTQITLMALCTQAKIDAQEAGYTELRRVWQPEVMAKIRAKQKSKPNRGPLPGTADDWEHYR